MHFVDRAKLLLVGTGSEWVLWLLVALSAASIAIIVERALALLAMKSTGEELRDVLVTALRSGGFAAGRTILADAAHPAARVAVRGMAHAESDTSPKQAEDAMQAEMVAQRRSLERRFAFLATLGSNAPFIGLFGTVVGILQAFDALGAATGAPTGALAPSAVMSSIAEALVATAVGLAVAIPAVFAFNLFQRRVKSLLDDAQMLSLEVLAHLHGTPVTPERVAPSPASARSALVLRPSRST